MMFFQVFRRESESADKTPSAKVFIEQKLNAKAQTPKLGVV